jgi:hypothetical protein
LKQAINGDRVVGKCGGMSRKYYLEIEHSHTANICRKGIGGCLHPIGAILDILDGPPPTLGKVLL